MQEKQLLSKISKAEQRIVDLYQKLKNKIDTGSSVLPYKSYVAIINQSSTSAPTVDVLLENTLGAAVTYAYDAVGQFNIKTINHKFTSGKTVIIVGPGRKTTANTFLGTTIANDELIVLYSYNQSGTAANGLISQVTVEIRVYN